jgi:transposase-like protein
VLKRLHYPLDVIRTCVRWYVGYTLSLRNLEEVVMAGRSISVVHSTVRRWTLKLLSGAGKKRFSATNAPSARADMSWQLPGPRG